MTLQDLTSYYVSLLAYEYRGRPNAENQVALFTKQATADFLASQLLTAFDIDTAVGAQLDIIGKYVGVARNIGVQEQKPYFGLWTYGSTLDKSQYQGTWIPSTDTPALPAASAGNTGQWYAVANSGSSTSPIAADFVEGDVIVSNGTAWVRQTTDNANGLSTYADLGVNVTAPFYTYYGSDRQYSDLTDDQYRTVLKLKVVLNSNDSTLATISQALWDFFGPAITVVDNADMTMTFFVYNTVPLSTDILKSYLPRPMGVGITISIVVPPSSTPAGTPITTEAGTPITTEQGTGFTITT